MTKKEYQVVLFTDFPNTVLTAKPLGAYKIASSLREAGYSCIVIDNLSLWNADDMIVLLNRVVSSSTLFVGFSTTFLKSDDYMNHQQLNQMLMYHDYNPDAAFYPQGNDYENRMVAVIKQLNPNCKIVLGGHKIHETCTNRNIDIIVRGLAELNIVNITNSLYNNLPIKDSYKNLYGIIVVSRDQEKEYDFANSPMHWEDTDILNYRILPFEPARGCIFNCKFCSYPQRGKKTLDYVLNEEIIYNELKNNYDRYGITTYHLMDDTFNDSDEKLDRIQGVINQLNFQPVFWAYNRLDLLATKSQRIQKMFDIGMRAVSFGIESLKRETGQFVGKGFDAQKQIETVQEIRRRYGNNLLMHGLFIIGLPYESLDEVQRTADLIQTQALPLHSAHFETLVIKKPNVNFSQSDFDKNWHNYGYEDMGSKDSKLSNWRNKLMTVYEADEMQQALTKVMQGDKVFHVPGQTAWALMNYPNFNLERIQSMKNSEVDWAEVTASKKQFFVDYKNQLFGKLNLVP